MKRPKKKTELRKCTRCPTMIEAVVNRLYCGACRITVKKETQKLHTSQTAEFRKRKYAEKKQTEAAKKVLITNDEQKAINKAVDNKHCVDQSVRRYFHCEVDTAKLFQLYA